MKKLIIPILIIIIVFLIYQLNSNNLINYMAIGDSVDIGINSYGNKTYGYNDYLKTYLENNDLLYSYNNFFFLFNYTIEELINDIDTNKNILYNDKTYNIKKELRESDLLTISIGMDELVKILSKSKEFNNIKSDLDIFIQNMDILLKKITELSKSKIILIGYYNPTNTYNKNIDKIFEYINNEYMKLSKKYNILYVDIYNVIKSDKTFLPNKIDYHVTSKGYLKITKEIIEQANL